MSAIKPGCLAIIVGLTKWSVKWNGRIVKVERLLPDARCLLPDGTVERYDAWEVSAEWLSLESTGLPWLFKARNLVPITDPDADIRTEDETEGLDDEIVRAASLAGLI